MLRVTKLYLDGDPLLQDVRSALTDTDTPLFGWAAESDAADNAQSACRVCVQAGGAMLWDSGWRAQREQRLRYAGPALPYMQPLQVRVWLRDTYGEEAAGEPCTFYNGLCGEWEGQWLLAGQDEPRRVIEFRKVFTLPDGCGEAWLYLAGVGYHKAWLNGAAVDDSVLDPATANYCRNVYYTVLPTAGQLLRAGENVLVIHVADGWRRHDSRFVSQALGERTVEFDGPPTLSAMLRWRDAAGEVHTLATDASWQWRYGPQTANLFDGEIYDASLADPAWLTAAAAGFAPVRLGPAPGGRMRPMTIAPIRQQETWPAIDLFQPQKGVYVADFGQNIAGVLRFRLPRPLAAGQRITVRFAEMLEEDGTLYRAPLRGAQQTDTYIAAGDGRDLAVWQPQFTYHGFRYAQIEGLPFVGREQLTAVSLYTDVASASSFRCGDALITRIHQNAVRTERANIHSILTDCPQRDERMGWMNDATVRFEETPYNFRVGRLFHKVVRDICAEQRPNGAITCCAPWVFGALPADPVCSSYLVAGAQALAFGGDEATLAEAFAGYEAWEEFLLSQSDEGIVRYSYYGDWAGPAYACRSAEDPVSAATPGILMSTGYSYYNCVQLAAFAQRLGRAQAAERWQREAAQVQAAFLKKWWHADTGRVADGSQGAQSFALWLDILPADLRARAAAVLHADLEGRGWRITTGNLCTRYMMDVLARFGYVQDAWRVLGSTEYPSYGYMIQNEATTVWERFELKKDPGMNSHDHPMYAAVDYWFYAWLCGIRPAAPGFDEVLIQPCYPQGLLSAQAVVDTVHGDVGVRWVRRFGEYQLYVHLPFGVRGTVCLPDGTRRQVGSGSHRFHWPAAD